MTFLKLSFHNFDPLILFQETNPVKIISAID